jgi:hypothetical protein
MTEQITNTEQSYGFFDRTGDLVSFIVGDVIVVTAIINKITFLLK